MSQFGIKSYYSWEDEVEGNLKKIFNAKVRTQEQNSQSVFLHL